MEERERAEAAICPTAVDPDGTAKLLLLSAKGKRWKSSAQALPARRRGRFYCAWASGFPLGASLSLAPLPLALQPAPQACGVHT